MSSRARSSSAPPRRRPLGSAPHRPPPRRPPVKPIPIELPSDDDEEEIGPPPLNSPPREFQEQDLTSDDEILPPPAEGPPRGLLQRGDLVVAVSRLSSPKHRVTQSLSENRTFVQLLEWHAQEDREAGTLCLLHNNSRLGVELHKDSTGWFRFQDSDAQQYVCHFNAETKVQPWQSRSPVSLESVPSSFGPFRLKVQGQMIVIRQPENSRDVTHVDSSLYVSSSSISFRDVTLASIRSPVREPPLPLGWSSYIDPNSTHTYYHNIATGEVCWTHPVTGLPHTPVGAKKLDFSVVSSASDNEDDLLSCNCGATKNHHFGCKLSPYYKEPTVKEGILTRVDARIRKRVRVTLEALCLHYGGKTPLSLEGATVEQSGKDKFSVTHGVKTVTFKASRDKSAWVTAISNNIYVANNAEDNPPPVQRESRLQRLRKRASHHTRSSSAVGRYTSSRERTDSWL